MAATTDRLRVSDLGRFGPARAAEAADAVDGVLPVAVVEPATAGHLAAALAWASDQRLSTLIRGAGTKLGWGRRPGPIDIVLATSRLSALVAHRHGDLTATVQAGAALQDVNRDLGTQGQWLPLDSAFDGATIGGIVATNDSGPLRSRYGTPRDLVIGITLALTDGRVVKSGGHVVKNVAGYDLGKLMSGSLGSLAAIVDVTFKLLPIPAASHTVVARYDAGDHLADDVARLSASQLEPVAFDLQVRLGPGGDASRLLLAKFATSPEAAESQAAAARSLLSGEPRRVAQSEEAAAWAEQVRGPWQGTGATIRLAWLPAALPDVLALVEDVCRVSGGRVALYARVMPGAGFLAIDADDGGVEQAVLLLRSRARSVSNVAVLRQTPALKARIDTWGPPPSAAAVMRALKDTFDPAGILNAGRGPV